jgi:F0F1-type ATP synthase delta subunit
MAKARYTARLVAAAIARASAAAKPEKLADEVARFLKAERLVKMWPAIARELQQPDSSAKVTVATAQPLAEAALAKLRHAWGNVEATVRPQLLGGAIVRRGDRQVDSSIAAQLRSLERAMRSTN